MNSIAIIDHVGNKSGMDIYDMSIATALNEHIKVYLLSNYENNFNSLNNIYTKTTFKKSLDIGNAIGKMKYFFFGFFTSFVFAKKKSIKNIIIHSFSYEYKDVIICFLARLFGFKIFIIAHDVSGFANEDKKIVKKIILNVLANKILVHNEFSRRELIKDVSVEKTITIRLGGSIDYVNLVNKENALFNLKLNSEYKYFLFFGQIKEVKGLDLLLKAFAKYNNQKTKLIIAGRAWKDDLEKYEDLINNLSIKDNVLFYNRYITDQEKDLFFSVADLVIIPYKKIYQSAVLLTAISYPTLILCSDLEPNLEIIEDGENGFLFKSSNVESLTDKLKQINLLSEEEIKKIKKNAFETVKNRFNWDYTANKILENI
jgi:glycosyltransferase involved in cell wall biosynthesis